MVSPTFFNLSLNLAIRSSLSEPQSAAPGLIFADCIELHSFGKEYNQSDLGIDHLMMSIFWPIQMMLLGTLFSTSLDINFS